MPAEPPVITALSGVMVALESWGLLVNSRMGRLAVCSDVKKVGILF